MLTVVAVCASLLADAQPLVDREEVPPGMVRIPAGVYEPAFRQDNDPSQVAVASFLLDVAPVTNAEYLEFVQSNPRWRRSAVKRIFADDQYLGHWAGDLDLGNIPTNTPVTRVSWFAAKAFARWKGKRLPATAEWEYAALASPNASNGSEDASFRAHLHSLYSAPTPQELPSIRRGSPNLYGIFDLHGLVWEWVSDFSTAMVTGDARGDTGLERQLFCGSGAQGAKDVADFPAFMRTAFRSSLKASYTVPNLGFRCAKDL